MRRVKVCYKGGEDIEEVIKAIYELWEQIIALIQKYDENVAEILKDLQPRNMLDVERKTLPEYYTDMIKSKDLFG